MRQNSGFTLVELLLVMVIISLLAGMVTIAVAGQGEKARRIRAQSDLSTYQRAIESYALQHQDNYPKTLAELAVEDADGTKYVEQVKSDGWKRPYVYRCPGKKNKKYDLYSRGKDGMEGTEDDISVWDE